MRAFAELNEIRSAADSEIGVSDWIEVTPDRIDPVAGATCDKAMDTCR